MKIKLSIILISFLLFSIFIVCSSSDNLVVKQQIAGLDTNCYLLYDNITKDAALIDVGGSIDTLVRYITDNQLKIKYFLFTHGHFDHVIGLPEIRDRYPEAKVCINKKDYEDMQIFLEWALKHKNPELLEMVRKNDTTRKLLEFDASTFKKPDIFLENDQTYKMGRFNIKTIHSPGHSPGSICFYTEGILFSGDVLMYKTVGGTDELNSSREELIHSVRKLYKLLPNSTKIYPGHGPTTDIGFEKKYNSRINVDGGKWSL